MYLQCLSVHRSLKLGPYITSIASKPKSHNDVMRFSVIGFRSDIRVELQAPVVSAPIYRFTVHNCCLFSNSSSNHGVSRCVARSEVNRLVMLEICQRRKLVSYSICSVS